MTKPEIKNVLVELKQHLVDNPDEFLMIENHSEDEWCADLPVEINIELDLDTINTLLSVL